ncbi:MAG: crotonase/enoyl-CoA hydratase family protein [Methylobacteriaceae bacterium]|nr:crotonase/enoyl-CoA hydratase family protein [Methylobacteriaceae bacterium]
MGHGRPAVTVRREANGPVLTVVIDRPEARNAGDPQTCAALLAAFESFESDDALAVAVLTGAGGHFCAGYDLKALSRGVPYSAEGDGLMGPSRRLLSKPVIAAVEGYAVAGGLELALWCDLRVAGESATFGVFCRRWGVPLVDGGTVRLPRLIGQSRALDMILTGRPVGAAEALAFGLANRVVPTGEARAEAERLAHELARFPQGCLRADRASAYAQWSETLPAALLREGRDGEPAIRQEAGAGAARFADGLGRGGDFGRI